MLDQACPSFGEKVLTYFQDIYDRNWYTEGKYTKLALDLFVDKTSISNVLPVPNGTLGIYLALLSLDLPKGSDVLVPSFTFYGSATPIIFAGLNPIFVDCCPLTYQSKLEHYEQSITDNTTAFLTIPIYGQSVDLNVFHSFAAQNNIKWVEDCAQGLGVFSGSKHVGSFGDVSIFSTFSDKSFGSGEGGFIASNSDEIFDNIRLLRNQGRPSSGTFIHPSLGMNFRITDMQAALMYEQLSRWDEIRLQRQLTWIKWHSLLSSIRHIVPQKIENLDESVPFRYAFTSPHFSQISELFKTNNIPFRGFFFPMHLQPKFSNLSTSYSFDGCNSIHSRGVCLPVHHKVNNDDIQLVSSLLNHEF